MSIKTELDAVDRHILRLLASDGRASYQALADAVGLSRPAVMERVKRLEESRYITGYGARLDRKKRSEEHTSELQSRLHLVCRLLLEKKKKKREKNSYNKSKENTIATTLPTALSDRRDRKL